MFTPIYDILSWKATALQLPIEKPCHETNKIKSGFVPDHQPHPKMIHLFHWKLIIAEHFPMFTDETKVHLSFPCCIRINRHDFPSEQ